VLDHSQQGGSSAKILCTVVNRQDGQNRNDEKKLHEKKHLSRSLPGQRLHNAP